MREVLLLVLAMAAATQAALAQGLMSVPPEFEPSIAESCRIWIRGETVCERSLSKREITCHSIVKHNWSHVTDRAVRCVSAHFGVLALSCQTWTDGYSVYRAIYRPRERNILNRPNIDYRCLEPSLDR